MATVKGWNPFGVSLNITATAGTVTRTSATKYTVKINASWATYYSGNKTNYGMTASSGGSSATINPFGTKASSGSGSFTGTYSISGNGSASKTITVTFKNFNNDNGDSATKSISLTVSVPAWTSYTVKYNANGGSGAPSSQTKWKDQTLTLSSTKPTRTGYSFQGWGTSASDTSVDYAAGAKYTANSGTTLYAIWKANTYTVSYNANGGSGAPSSQTKTYGVTLTLSSTKPTRTNYTFKGWGTSASATTVAYSSGASYTTNAAITLYAIWELAYIKPKITNIMLRRCDSSGVYVEDGTYALVEFDWSCEQSVSNISITWQESGSTSPTSKEVTASGTSGSVSEIVGSGALSADHVYAFKLTVTDSGGSTIVSKTLSSQIFPIDVLPENKGIAFGKSAERAGHAEFAYDLLLNKNIYMYPGKSIFVSDDDTGTLYREYLQLCSTSGGNSLGYGSYSTGRGDTYIYGHDIRFGVSNLASKTTYKPYYSKGDSISVYLATAGYVTNSKKDVYFIVPLSKPVIGSPTITASSRDGLRLRHNDLYTHGSAASTWVTPSSYETTLRANGNYVEIIAKFTTVTNVTNNDSIGVNWSGTITFS